MNDEILAPYIERVILEIIAEIGSMDLTAVGSEDVLVQKIASILSQFNLTVQQVLPPALIQQYFSGVDEATALLAQATASASATTAVSTTAAGTVAATAAVTSGAAAGMAITKNGLIAKPFQKPIHLKAVENLIEMTMGDMDAAIRMAGKVGPQELLKTLSEVKNDMVTGQINGDARKVIQKRVIETFVNKGLTAFETKDHKLLPVDFYAMTVVRTKMRDAVVAGNANRYEEMGQDLVIITGNGDSCATCSKFNGMVVSLRGETPGYPVVGENGVRLAPYHPNCRCGVRPFILKYATEEEREAAQKKNKRYDPDKDTRTPAQKRAYENEQKIRRQANREKKEYLRWKEILGDKAPASIGAFRRMKRSNSSKYKELRKAYLSVSPIEP